MLDVAPGLLGRWLVHRVPEGVVAVRLTEVEAYAGPADPGSHAFRGRTSRTAVMFGPPAHLYVYFSYGMHWCVNVVCGPEGTASAVLLRAGEVVEGHALARSRRPSARTDRDLARGPARLAATLGINGSHDGLALGAAVPGGAVEITGEPGTGTIRTGPRVGVRGAGGDGALFPWRFWLDDEPTVSTYRPAVGRKQRRREAGPTSGTLGPDAARDERAREREGRS